MSRYREITPIQEPFDGGLDKAGRVMLRCNFRIIKTPSVSLLTELIGRLVSLGVGTSGTNIFGSSRAEIPVGAGPYLTIIETGGTSPDRTHNEVVTPAWQQPSVQITVRAKTYESANVMMRAAYSALVGVRNVTIS